MKAKKSIYNLELHETLELNLGICSYAIIRVEGGWIYFNPRLDRNQMNSTFVPFNNEFK